MKTIEKLQRYEEAKAVWVLYRDYTGDKRRSFYKRVERSVFEIAARRVNNFGTQLGLPTFNELMGY